jgi:predicted ATP-grasp superfamily ATP-dependent carboligase
MIGRPAILVVAYSARALSSSAARAGFAPLAIDVFGDDDTRETSLSCVKLDGGLADGFEPDKIVRAVESLAEAHDPVGLVYGAGFEHQPETLGLISGVTRVFGNSAATLSAAKDPLALARVCEANRVRHPPIAFSPPDEPELWLVKKRGAAGGAHIAAAHGAGPAPPDSYYQLRVPGQSVSALFLASAGKAAIIGLSTQWTAPASDSPFRYGGAAGPVDVGQAEAADIARAVSVSASEFSLVGLNSADFLLSPDGVSLIEINPRPGATLDVFESDEAPLLARHLAACEGRLSPMSRGAACKAAEIVYAPHDLVVRRRANWPDWAVDRSAPGTHIAAGDPFCTILASGATADLARAYARERANEIIARVREAAH